MTTEQFLSSLGALDIEVWAVGDRLRVSAPKGALTAGLRAELADRKQQILAFLDDAGVSESRGPPVIPRAQRDQELELSWAQERLWFLDQLASAGAAYNMPQAVRLDGRLDVAAFERSLSEILRRHEALRTTFRQVEGRVVQVVSRPEALGVQMVDLAELPKERREIEVRRRIAEEAGRAFDLARGPLLRSMLLRLTETEHVLLVTMHHIVSDGWSLGILERELGALYGAYSAGEPSPLPEPSIQYADFAQWQRQRLQREACQSDMTYWRQHLGDGVPALQLPTNRQRPPIQTNRGAQRSLILPETLCEDLKTLSREEGVTLFMTLLAAFQILLHRYTGQHDIAVGTPVAGRSRTELEHVIGCFINMLVLRTDLSGNPSFDHLLQRVRDTTLGALAHQDVPFEKLIEELRPKRDLSRPPLFQVMLMFQNVPRQPLELAGLTVSPMEVESSTSRFDLALSVTQRATSIAAKMEYNTDLFDEATIDRLMRHYQALLQGAVEQPELGISDLPLLSRAERRQLLVGWNDTRREYEQDRCIHELFEAQAELTPEAVAVTFEHQSLTYAELDRRANRLANHLRGLGVSGDVLVGICVERSLEMLVGLLGVLKAGGAYVPLDPSYPPERLAFMLKDAGVDVVLTQPGLAADLLEGSTRAVCLTTDWREIGSRSANKPVEQTTAGNLAYVNYTSGSTGRPKGVQVTHRSVVNFLTSMRREPGLGHHDVLLAVTTISFDISVLELFLPLSVGARVVIVGPGVAADGAQLMDHIATSGATVMQATPATWRLLLRSGWKRGNQLKVLCGGEALQRDLAKELIERCGSVWNMYGPTETTIWSTCHRLTDPDAPVLIGRPIANTQAYVLDGQMRPVPVGVPGELCIGGDGVAGGYLNRPDLTAELFVPDSFRQSQGARLYKTGDLARYHEDGTLEYLKRVDDQVKIRGSRVEPGEVESVLHEHESVEHAVVVARDYGPGDVRLVGCVVPRSEGGLSVRELRRHLRARVPEYMVPAHWVELESLPLTGSGKIDREALPPPEAGRIEHDRSLELPETAEERWIAAVFRERLGLSEVGVHDNFFDLGGHSLLAVEVIFDIERRTRHRLSPADLAMQTVRQLATVCDEASQGVSEGVQRAPLWQRIADGIKIVFSRP